ncbi:MAG: zinc ribbon domain-containing protein [Nitrospinota bacterium]|nr:zinc ribbon domain-containing protein [Nitrospinota bacterium]
MPIYEYECQKCGEHFEVTQRMSDPVLTKHANESKCGGKVVKLMSANTFHLKGTGWYKTDYAKSDQQVKADAKKDKAETTDTSTAKESTGKKETSPAKDSTEKKETPPKKETASKKEAAKAPAD